MIKAITYDKAILYGYIKTAVNYLKLYRNNYIRYITIMMFYEPHKAFTNT